MKKLFLLMILFILSFSGYSQTQNINTDINYNKKVYFKSVSTLPSPSLSSLVFVKGVDGQLQEVDVSTLLALGGGSQDLQQTLDNGNHAEYDSGKSKIDLLYGFNLDKKTRIISGDGTSLGSLFVSKNSVYLYQSDDDSYKNSIEIYNNKLGLYQSGVSGSTSITLQDQIAPNVNLFFPAKPTGDYILATLDDTGLQKSVEAVPYYIGDKGVFGYAPAFSNGIAVTGKSGGLASIIGNTQVVNSTLPDVDGNRSTIALNMVAPDVSLNKSLNFFLPNTKADGSYTLATLDDISGGGGSNLQSVLDSNGYAQSSLDGITSTISIFEDDEEKNNIFRVAVSADDLSKEGYIGVSVDGASIQSSNDIAGVQGHASITAQFAKIKLEQGTSVGNLNTTVTFEDPIDSNTFLKFPAKSAGTYTLATLDDISGGGGNLQSVLEAGAGATFDSGNQIINIFNPAVDPTMMEMRSIASGLGLGQFSMSASGVSLGNSRESGEQAQLDLGAGHITMQEMSLTGSTFLDFEAPTAETFIRVPAKSAGTYTLATLDDISNTPVSSTVSGIVNNTALQELGGVDKLIHGVRIGKGNSTGVDNVVFGLNSQNSATTGAENHSFGFESLKSVTTGSFNSAFGWGTLQNNTTGDNNIAVGDAALFSNISGTDNTAVGTVALYSNTTGGQNTAVGKWASYANTTGNRNVAVGLQTLQNNSTGTGNVAIGDNALASTNTSDNIGIGRNAGQAMSSGSANVIIATSATTTGGISTGSNNLIIAPNSGSKTGITTGSGNIVVGKVTGLAAAASNTITIADGVGNIAITKNTNGELLAPNLTQALIISGGATSFINKTYVDNMGAVDNATTAALSGTTLSTTYPNALNGFRAHCASIAAGALTYEKTSTGWIQYTIITVAP